jgi:hypothetical protein
MAFIQFCKYNTNVQISESLRAICVEKPDEYDDDVSIEENIEAMKRGGHHYSQEAFQQLMQVINRENIVHIGLYNLQISHIQQMRDLLDSMRDRDITEVPALFRDKLYAVLETFEVGALMEDTSEMRDLKNYLGSQNDGMKHELLDFISRSKVRLSGKPKIYRVFKECLENIGIMQDMGGDNETTFKMVQYMKNTIRNLVKVFPNIVLNKVDYNAVNIPTHWKLSEKHNKDLRDMLSKHYSTFIRLYDDSDIEFILRKISNVDIMHLSELTEFYAPLSVAEGKKIYSVFDERMTTLLFTYYFYLILINLKNTSEDEDIILRSLAIPSISIGDRDEGIGMLPSVSSVESQERGELPDFEIIQGEKKMISDKVADIIYTFTNIVCANKTTIDYNYNSFMERVLRSKEKEKDIITDYLKEMTGEEREIENLFKNNKLERWSKGLQKGLRVYQKDTYDDERDVMEKQALAELRMGETNVVTEMNRNIYAMDAIDEQLSAEEISSEEMSLKHIANDDDYGDHDGDESY